MSRTLALKNVAPAFALILLTAFVAHASSSVGPSSGARVVDNGCGCQPTPTPAPAPQPGFTFSITPTTPTVYDSNYPLGGGDYVQAPWFMFVPQMVNDTGRVITVMTMEIETVFNLHGVAYTNSYQVVKSPWGGIFQSLPGKPLTVEEYYIGPIDMADSSSYKVTLHMDGWYGSSTNPQERFHQDFSFKTK